MYSITIKHYIDQIEAANCALIDLNLHLPCHCKIINNAYMRMKNADTLKKFTCDLHKQMTKQCNKLRLENKYPNFFNLACQI